MLKHVILLFKSQSSSVNLHYILALQKKSDSFPVDPTVATSGLVQLCLQCKCVPSVFDLQFQKFLSDSTQSATSSDRELNQFMHIQRAAERGAGLAVTITVTHTHTHTHTHITLTLSACTHINTMLQLWSPVGIVQELSRIRAPFVRRWLPAALTSISPFGQTLSALLLRIPTANDDEETQ